MKFTRGAISRFLTQVYSNGLGCKNQCPTRRGGVALIRGPGVGGWPIPKRIGSLLLESGTAVLREQGGAGREASLAGTKHVRLRVGVVGLGRLWEARHKPAPAKMPDRFTVVAVYDQVARRAEIEAVQLSCEPVDGLIALIDRPDVDVVYLLTPQWFGLHPIEVACSLGKPVYCALPLAGCGEELD